MEEIGQVVKTEGNKAFVRITRHSACSKCDKKCGLAVESSHESDQLDITVNNSVGVSRGQFVRLEMEESSVVLVSLIVYIFPLIALIAGYFIGMFLAEEIGILTPEGSGIIFALLSLLLSFLLVRLADRKLGEKERFKPKITAVIK